MDTERTAEEVSRLLRAAKLHQMRKALDEASVACRQAMELDPGSADACELMGDLLVSRGELEAALDHYQRAMKLQPRAATEERVARLALRIAEEKQRSAAPDTSPVAVAPRRANPSVACALSMLWPGLGQLYNGEHRKGLALFAAYFFDFVLIVVMAIPHVRALRYAVFGSGRAMGGGPPVPALLWLLLLVGGGLWIYALIDASLTATALSRGERRGAKTGWEV
ncbi:MAG: hypothetical protein HY321_07755 [Armatimonadetes bacterium]|nr:hypothetical protein [Armatimonadota bacterium]